MYPVFKSILFITHFLVCCAIFPKTQVNDISHYCMYYFYKDCTAIYYYSKANILRNWTPAQKSEKTICQQRPNWLQYKDCFSHLPPVVFWKVFSNFSCIFLCRESVQVTQKRTFTYNSKSQNIIVWRVYYIRVHLYMYKTNQHLTLINLRSSVREFENLLVTFHLKCTTMRTTEPKDKYLYFNHHKNIGCSKKKKCY